MTGDHHGRSRRETHREHERGAFAGPPSTDRPTFAGGRSTTAHDPALPILRELEELVRAAAIAAEGTVAAGATAGVGRAAGAGTAAGTGTAEGAPPARPGVDPAGRATGASRRPARVGPTRGRAGSALGGIVPRGLVLALLACTVGATATALTRNDGTPRADRPAVTVLQGTAAAADWRLQVARRGGRFCVSLTAAGPTVAGASVDPDCQAAPARRAVVPRSFATADRVIVHGLAGASVRAVAVTLDGRRRTRRSVPVPGAPGVRAFALVFRREAASSAASSAGPVPRVRPVGRGGRPLGPAVRDCSASSCSP